MASHPAPTEATADFGTRFSAFVIDAAVLFGVQWLVVIVASRQLQAVGMSSTQMCGDDEIPRMCEGPSTLLWALILLFLVASTIGYHAYFEGRFGATPGKRWMGLRVVKTQSLAPLDAVSAGLRAVVRQLFWLLPFFVFDISPLSLSLPPILLLLVPLASLAVFVLAAFRPDGRGLHDLAADTLVVRSDQLPATPQVAAATSRSEETEETEETEESV